MTPSGSMNEMARLLSRGDVKIYLFNGDWDSVVPFGDTVKNLMRLGVRQQIPTAPWSSGDQHAGFNKTYDYGLSFYTVKGAGH